MRKLAIFAGAFSAAVLLWRYGLWILPAAAAVLLVLAGLVFFGRPEGKPRRLRCLLLAGGMAAALLWCAAFAQMTLTPWEPFHQQKDVALQARVEDWPGLTSTGMTSVDARFIHPVTGAETEGVLYLPQGMELSPGDVLSLTGTVYLADRLRDRQVTYYSARGDFLRVYAQQVEVVESKEGPSLKHLPLWIAQGVRSDLYELYSDQTAPLAVALLMGDKTGLDEHFTAMSRRAGLAHIVVVSGMHVSILAGALAALLGKHTRRGAVATLALLCFFALMAGGTVSAWRAVILCGFGLLAPLVNRENDPPTSLLTALMVLLMVNPFSAASISLQLSFGAVAGIQLLAPALTALWDRPRPRKGPKYQLLCWKLYQSVTTTLYVSLGAVLFTTPLSALYFGTVSLISPLSNLLTLWAVSAVFLLSLALLVLGHMAPLLCAPILPVAELLSRFLLWVIQALGALPFAAVTTTSPYVAIALAGAYLLLCLRLLQWRRSKGRWRVALGCCLAVALTGFGLNHLEYALSDLTVAVLDVGQGQSVCVEAEGRAVLVDCGGSGYNNAGGVAADYLADRGITTLDALVLTHYHADHANGVPELLRRMEVKELILPDTDRTEESRREILALAEEEGARVRFITENTAYPLGGEAALTLYAPLGDGGANERGLSVLAGTGDYDVLITGDMNERVEHRLIKYGNLPDVELLVAGHHGSRTSTGEALLRTTRPETAVISVGEGNPYGHPAAETLTRLSEHGAVIYRTDRNGTVVLHWKEEG